MTSNSETQIERFHNLSQELLNYSNKGLLRKDFLPMVAECLLESSRSDAVELWVKEGELKHFRCALSRFEKMPFGFILVPCPLGEEAAPSPGDGDELRMEQLCSAVINGDIQSSQQCMTSKGSFYASNTAEPISLRGSGTLAVVRWPQRLPEHYRSLALIPIDVEGVRVGLLQLKSVGQDFYSLDELCFLEDIAEVLGIAVTHQYAQIELRERIKELTCLYGIAQVVVRTGVDTEQIIQEIVELLPPAWLYPEIACARILLDGQAYTTVGFSSSPFRQRAEIMVKGEHMGFVEVCYLEKRIIMDEGPFLNEERSLIDSVAREVAYFWERTRAEAERALLHEQLRHADRLATIGQLAAGVAHELNEPLGNILGLAQLTQKTAILEDEARDDLGAIESAALHAREIIRKLMVFARQLPSMKVAVALNDVVEESLYFFEARCAKIGVELVRHFAPGLPPITADPGQLNQVLVNLVVNALQAMPAGGTLTVRTHGGGSHVVLDVEDTGIGMNDEVRRQIFLPFFTTKDINEGTGLGLAVVHGIVSNHGGIIEVSSRVGVGTRFTISFDATDPGGEG